MNKQNRFQWFRRRAALVVYLAAGASLMAACEVDENGNLLVSDNGEMTQTSSEALPESTAGDLFDPVAELGPEVYQLADEPAGNIENAQQEEMDSSNTSRRYYYTVHAISNGATLEKDVYSTVTTWSQLATNRKASSGRYYSSSVGYKGNYWIKTNGRVFHNSTQILGVYDAFDISYSHSANLCFFTNLSGHVYEVLKNGSVEYPVQVAALPNGESAVKIDVDEAGNPWVVTVNGNLYSGQLLAPGIITWTLRYENNEPGYIIDVGAARDSVWLVANHPQDDWNYWLIQFDKTNNTLNLIRPGSSYGAIDVDYYGNIWVIRNGLLEVFDWDGEMHVIYSLTNLTDVATVS